MIASLLFTQLIVGDDEWKELEPYSYAAQLGQRADELVDLEEGQGIPTSSVLIQSSPGNAARKPGVTERCRIQVAGLFTKEAQQVCEAQHVQLVS